MSTARSPLAAFLAYRGEIERSVLNRNWKQLAASLRRRTSSRLPREVREELVLLTRSSRNTMRAPVQFLRFQHRMIQLAADGGSMPNSQVELDLVPDSRAARRAGDGRRVAARKSDQTGDRDDDSSKQA